MNQTPLIFLPSALTYVDLCLPNLYTPRRSAMTRSAAECVRGVISSLDPVAAGSQARPGAYLSGTTHLIRPEYTCALRLRILRSPASCLGRRRSTRMAGCVVWCHCNRRVSLTTDPMHAYTSCSSEGQFIRRHNHIYMRCRP